MATSMPTRGAWGAPKMYFAAWVGVLLVTGLSLVPVAPAWGVGVAAGAFLVVLVTRLQASVLLLTAITLFTASVMVWLRLIRFHYLPQALYLLGQGTDPADLIVVFSLWGPRFLLTYPAVLLSRSTAMDLNTAFTVYGTALVCVLIATTCALLRVAQVLPASAARALPAQLVVIAFWLGLSMFMNGRLVIAFLGMVILCISQVRSIRKQRIESREIALQVIAVIFTMMSSGTMMVGFFQFILGNLLVYRTARAGRPVSWPTVGLGLAAVLGLLVPFIYAGIRKNLEYFEGSIVQMLGHGLGQFLLLDPLVTALVVIAALAVVAAAFRFYRMRLIGERLLTPIVASVPIAMAFGAFGYSTMMTALPGLLVIAIWYLLRR